MKRHNVWVPDPDHEVLTALSEKKDIPVAELIRKAISDFLEKAKRKGELQ